MSDASQDSDAPNVSDVPSDGDPIVEARRDERRIWPSLVVCVALVPATILVSAVSLVVGLAVFGRLDAITDADNLMTQVTEIMREPLGLAILVLPGQLVFLSAAVLPAWLSPVPTAKRLGFRRPGIPLWSLPILMVSTPAIGLVSMPVARLLFGDEPSEQLEMLFSVFHDSSPGAFVVIAIVLSVVPGFVEETLFRGYLFRGFMRRGHPVLAIGVTSVLFALAHVDPQHAVLVFPLGIWVGVITWRSGSVVPAVLCHAFNNVYGIIATRLLDPDAVLTVGASWSPIDVTFVAVGVAAIVTSLWVLFRTPGR